LTLNPFLFISFYNFKFSNCLRFITEFLKTKPQYHADCTKRVLKVTQVGYSEVTMLDILEYESPAIESDNSIVWFDIDSICKLDMQALEEKFDIHPLTTEDIMSEARDKIENFGSYVFIVARELHYATHSNKLVSCCVFILIFPHVVLTFHKHEAESIPKVFYTIEVSQKKKGFLTSSDWVLYAVLNAMVNLSMDQVNGIVMEGEALDELVLILSGSEQGDLLRRVGNARRLMTSLRNQIWSKKELLLTFNSKSDDFITDDIKFYLRDVLDHLLNMEQRLDVSKEMLNNLHQTYLSRISLEMAEAGTQVNYLMKKFSAVGTVVLPLTLIAGIWGMNVHVPGQGELDDNYAWFGAICSAMVLYTVGLFYLFKKKKWV